jgi:sugar phosphate isomerase/epimerase
MRLALSGFLFEDAYRDQSVPFDRFCAIARDAGYDAVELRRTQVSPDTPAGERRALLRTVHDHGLFVSCLTARKMPREGAGRDAFFLAYLELCEALDCHLLKAGGEPAWLAWACDQAAARDVTVAANNHLGGRFETVAGTRAMLEAVPHPRFGLLYDPFHLHLAGEDYTGCIPALLPRMRNVLMQTVRPAGADASGPTLEMGGRRWVRALPGEPGTQDWPAVFRALRSGGYDGLVTVIENSWPAAQREDVARHCARYVRETWEAP